MLVYRNISLENLITYFSTKNNLLEVYPVVTDFTYKEFLGFVCSQKSVDEALKFFSENEDVFRSTIDRIMSVNMKFSQQFNNSCSESKQNDTQSNLDMPTTFDPMFNQQFETSTKIEIRVQNVAEIIHGYEKEIKTLACNMSLDQINELIRRSDNRVTSTMYTNFILLLRIYIKSQIDLGFCHTGVNIAKQIDHTHIDISENMKKFCFADRESLKQFLYNVFPDISENNQYNRAFLAACLAYDGVQVEDMLTLKISDVKDGVLHYNEKNIPLDSDEIKILDQWNSGWYYLRENSNKRYSLMDDGMLIRSHKPMTASYFGNSLGNRSEKFGFSRITLSDIQNSGIYYRYVFENANEELPQTMDDMFKNDIECWKKAFGYK